MCSCSDSLCCEGQARARGAVFETGCSQSCPACGAAAGTLCCLGVRADPAGAAAAAAQPPLRGHKPLLRGHEPLPRPHKAHSGCAVGGFVSCVHYHDQGIEQLQSHDTHALICCLTCLVVWGVLQLTAHHAGGTQGRPCGFVSGPHSFGFACIAAGAQASWSAVLPRAVCVPVLISLSIVADCRRLG